MFTSTQVANLTQQAYATSCHVNNEQANNNISQNNHLHQNGHPNHQQASLSLLHNNQHHENQCNVSSDRLINVLASGHQQHLTSVNQHCTGPAFISLNQLGAQDQNQAIQQQHLQHNIQLPTQQSTSSPSVSRFLDTNQHLVVHFNQHSGTLTAGAHFVDGLGTDNANQFVSVLQQQNQQVNAQLTGTRELNSMSLFQNHTNHHLHHSNSVVSQVQPHSSSPPTTASDKLEGQRNSESPRRTFACPTCGKAFTEKFNMKRHMQIHSLSRPKYICNECSKSFAWKDNFVRHKKAAHGSSLPIYQVK